MYPISALYAEYLKRQDREFKVKAIINGIEYDDTVIVDFSVENSITSSDEFEIGTAIPSKLTITLRSQIEVPSNAKIIPYLSLSVAGMTWNEAVFPWEQMEMTWLGGIAEWIPMGEYFVDSREKVNDVWTYTCYDKLVFSDVPYVSSLTYPATQKAVWDEICSRLGWTYDSSVVINSSFKVQAGPAGFSMRQMIGYIASSNNASVYVGKDGIVRFKRYSASYNPVFTMTGADYIHTPKQTNPVKTYTRVVVTYDTEDNLTYEAGSGDENHTLYIENPFATQTITNSILAGLNGFAYLPVSMSARGFPQLDQGDAISFEQFEGRSWIDSMTSWEETDIPWNGITTYQTLILHQSFSFKGGLIMTIDSPSASEQQSEFVVEGSLTQQVNNLNKNAVKEGKAYYGATITRTAGITVEREDQLSKVVLNSDELTFYAGSDKALWFDLPNRKFKFGGDLEASGGTFSGTLQAVDGIFTGTLQGVDGTFTGTLQAGSVVGGDITGTTITGSNIIGSSLKTSLSGRRIEIDVDGLHSYGSNGEERISISTNDSFDMGAITFPTAGRLWGTSSLLQLLSTTTMQIVSTSSGGINFQGGVDFSSSPITGIGINKVDGLSSRLNSIDSDVSSVQISVNSKANTSEAGYNLAFDPTSRNLKLYSKTGDLLAQVNIP